MVDRGTTWQLYVEVAVLAIVLSSRLGRELLYLPHFALARSLFCFNSRAVTPVRPNAASRH